MNKTLAQLIPKKTQLSNEMTQKQGGMYVKYAAPKFMCSDIQKWLWLLLLDGDIGTTTPLKK